jgi:hypothetical protein
MAVATGPARQTEDAVLEIEMLDVTGFAQALGNVFGVLVIGFKRIHQPQADQIRHFDLDRHGAAVGGA